MKESSLKVSLGTLALLSLAAIAALPALANSAPINSAESYAQTTAVPGQNLPFFARFLEGQESTTATDRIALTDDSKVTTAKFPSDQEDGGDVKIVVPTNPSQKPGENLNLTRKYPSDQEDNTGDRPTRIRDRNRHPLPGNGGQSYTKKYPSDNEDGSPTNIYR